MGHTPGDIESLTERVIGCAMEVHRTLGPGLLESVYRDCLLIELREAGLKVDHERRVTIAYKGRPIAGGLKTLKAGLRRLSHPDLYRRQL